MREIDGAEVRQLRSDEGGRESEKKRGERE